MTRPTARSLRPTATEVLDVAACAAFLGTTEIAIRARVRRRQLPFRRFGRRIVFLRAELTAYLAALPGCRPPETLLDHPGPPVSDSSHTW